jgi:o-succinylbenzoate synthase
MRVEPFAIDLADPLETARGTITEREGFVVALDVDGITGVGEAAPLPGWTESLDSCEAALERAAEVIEAEPAPAAPSDLDRVALQPLEAAGAVREAVAGAPAARHAVATAVLDARSHAAMGPLYRLLERGYREDPDGSEASSDAAAPVPVNATIGDDPPEATAAEAADAVGWGFETVKLKVGARSVAADIERVAAVRERCPEVTLRADANGAWDPEQAERALDAFAEYGVSYVEQPFPVDATADGGTRRDLSVHAALRGGPVGVALDESLATGPDAVAAALEADAADTLVLKPMALGGPDRAVAAARRAQEAGVEPVITTTIDGALARATAVHVAAAVPDISACGLATADRLATDLLDTDPAPVVDGRVKLRPLLGVVGETHWHQPSDSTRG